MIKIDIFKGAKVALFGLGSSGIATAQALMLGGSDVIAFDDNATSVARAKQSGIKISDLRDIDWGDIKALILSPGVPLTQPEPHWGVKLAQAKGVEIIGDVELFVRQRNEFLTSNDLSAQDCPFIAITGTNGKSTTTALIAHLLHDCGFDVQMGGNIGTAILLLEPFKKGRYYVIECSSYQIDLTPSINPTIGILLNLTPDHIDRHGSFEHYGAVKERLIAQADLAIVAVDDDFCKNIAARVLKKHHRLIACSTSSHLDVDWFADNGKIFYRQDEQAQEIVNLNGHSALRGQHNAQNALTALACAFVMGADRTKIIQSIATFKGLAHRMEEVRRQGHVVFINDSKATNAEATAPALATFDHIYWIAGGVAKEGGITSLQAFFPKIRKAYLIGEAAESFAQTIGSAISVVMSGTLEAALQQAAYDAAHDRDIVNISYRGDNKNCASENCASENFAAVLFSPACASFDQFANYGARGDFFRKLVQEI